MMLYNPQHLVDTLCEFGTLPSEQVYFGSHKVMFEMDKNQGILWNMEIIDNTYSVSLQRTYDNLGTWMGGETKQSVNLLIKNLGAFHLAIETALNHNKSINSENKEKFLQGLCYLKKTYGDRKDLIEYIDREILPLFTEAPDTDSD